MRWLSLALVCLVTSCNMNYGGDAKYTDHGREKPTVEVLPLIDRTQTKLPWSLSKELTDFTRDRLKQSGRLLVAARAGAYPEMLRYTREDLMGTRMDFAKDFKGANYILLMELVSHQVTPYTRNMDLKPIYPVGGGEATEVIQMSLHMRLIDVRTDEPRVVMQREMPSNHLVPKGKEFANIGYADIRPGDPRFLATPLGRAHARMIRDVAEQVEQYIGLSR